MDPRFSFLSPAHAGYIDEVFEKFRENPDSVDSSWRYFFEGVELGAADPSFAGASTSAGSEDLKIQALLHAYREFGHLIAKINPLETPASTHPFLDPKKYGLDPANEKVKQSIEKFRSLYCGSVALNAYAMTTPEEKEWFTERFEALSRVVPSIETKKRIFYRLSEAETLERFLHTRYVAVKRFSLEGGESLIPALDAMFETASESGAKEAVIGMAHRGRLNVLVNVTRKEAKSLFAEFEGVVDPDPTMGEGDVKYHLGYSNDVETSSGKKIHLSLAYNPSHLEFVDAVVGGMAKAKIFLRDQVENSVLPVLIHGDAAFAGQGVVYETLTCSTLPGYRVGGSLHIVLNNQVGFTTPPSETRSTTYPTDLAKFLGAPILHVNGDDPEAVWKASALLTEYRTKFGKDAFLNLVCYRKYGHNEGDEPSFTQPKMYEIIKSLRSTREQYGERLSREGVMDAAEQDKFIESLMDRFGNARDEAKAATKKTFPQAYEGLWKEHPKAANDELFAAVPTQVDAGKLKSLSKEINSFPKDFHLHSKLGRFFEARDKAIQEGKGIDWGNAEVLAYATLLREQVPIRLSGQDVLRGTFTHRHAGVCDTETGTRYIPLQNLGAQNTAPFFIYNSHLSETGALGFDYGWSLSYPRCLTIWEAQFGDFANGAQVIIDQFLASGESKWNRSSGLTLLLPHGFEGQGPEHSSARLERFLALSGRDNWFVTMPTTPAQIFHLLRRQALRKFRKPLIVMTPKSLLRHPLAVSTLEELSEGRFQEAIDDLARPKKARKVLLCSGKVYYDLLAEIEARKTEKDIAIIRVEQLYPFPEKALLKILSTYPEVKEFTWVQEEPQNMGSWNFLFSLWNGGTGEFGQLLGNRPLRYVGRGMAAAPAVGSAKLHAKEQKALVENALR